jgi:hypothetical protein
MFQMAQSKAQTTTQICTLFFFSTPANQFPNKFVMLADGIILKAM